MSGIEYSRPPLLGRMRDIDESSKDVGKVLVVADDGNTYTYLDTETLRGPKGDQGDPGPNKVSTSTTTNITGILKGDGSVVSAATAGADYVAVDDSRLSDAREPTSHAASHAAAGSDPLTLSKSQVGLDQVDNTSDANKPVSTATATAIAPITGITLGTSEANKAVTANASNFVGIGVGPHANYRLSTSSLHVLNGTFLAGAFDIGDTSTDTTHVTGGMYFARSGSNEPFIRFRSGGGATAGSQIRGAVGGGIRFTDDTNNVEWFKVLPTGSTFNGNVTVGPSGAFLAPSGSASNPSVQIGTSTGLYSSASNTLELSVNSSRVAYLNTAGLTVNAATSGTNAAIRSIVDGGFVQSWQNTATGGGVYHWAVTSNTYGTGGGRLLLLENTTSSTAASMTVFGGKFGFGSGNYTPTDPVDVGGHLRVRGVAKLAPYTVATLPTTGVTAGSISYASNGRKAGEGSGAGTGCPVWYDGTNWKTFYDNTTVAA